MFGGNFAPTGWMFCAGQTLAISEYEVLFTLIGTTYGGDGVETFKLPDLQGRLPVHQGSLQGNTVVIGQSSGTETVTLTTNQIPAHSHLAAGSLGGGNNVQGPAGSYWSTDPQGNTAAYSDQTNSATMLATAIGTAGGGQPHDNLQPFLVVNFIISLFGVYPSQN